MEAKDDELQTNFGATRCSIWELALVCTGCHREMGITGEGVTVGDWGRLGAQHYQHFC